MSHKQGENREQMTLTPLCLDDYISEGSVCRVIDVYVGSLDMGDLGFKYAEAKSTGRQAYNPADMLKLYIYGYMNRVRSSRRLEAETHRNIEVMWLLRKLTPDDKTICNFRKDNSGALKKAFREFSFWCVKQSLCNKELAAVDGTKIRANANRHSIHTAKGTKKMLAEVNAKIDKYIEMLEKADAEEENMEKAMKGDVTNLSADTVKSILKHLNEKKETIETFKAAIEENDGKEVSTVDPKAHLMHTREPDEQRRRDFRNANGSIAFRRAVLPRFLRQNSETATGEILTLATMCKT
jgi:transposase